MSLRLYEDAKDLLVGGVNSPVRAAVRPSPFFVASAKGPYVVTEDGERLVDYVLGYGPLILGHADDRVMKSVIDQVERGWLYGAPTRTELELARKVLWHVMPGGRVRFVNSGTEATMTAIRLARGFTGRQKVLKFDGCYHGAHDSVLVQAGSAASEFGVPNSAGVPPQVASLTLVARFNDAESAERAARQAGHDLAAIIVEPVIGNMGVIPPDPEFLRSLRELADRYGALLIFDEVITGFRIDLGGAQKYYGVRADIVTLGKIIGGGFPVGAVVARREVMESLAPLGPVFNAGTFNAHPVTMAAGLATVSVLESTDALSRASRAAREVAGSLERAGITVNRVESMFQAFMTNAQVRDADDARRADRAKYVRLHEALRRLGAFIPPSQFESWFTSSAHDEEAVTLTVNAVERAVRETA